MNWSRLGRAVTVALLGSFVLGAILSPPDPFAQSLYAGVLLLLGVPLAYRFGPRVRSAIHRRG